MDKLINGYNYKSIGLNSYEVLNKDLVLGKINYKIISTMNEYKLIELDFDTFDYLVVYNFIEYLIKEESVLKIIVKNNNIEILNKLGFVSDKDAYKLTKPMFLQKGV